MNENQVEDMAEVVEGEEAEPKSEGEHEGGVEVEDFLTTSTPRVPRMAPAAEAAEKNSSLRRPGDLAIRVQTS